jgi:hypothetical protein
VLCIDRFIRQVLRSSMAMLPVKPLDGALRQTRTYELEDPERNT